MYISFRSKAIVLRYSFHQTGKGYRLKITKTTANKDNKLLAAAMKEHVPNAVVLSEAAVEVIMTLPAEDEAKFYELFKDLGENGPEMGILNFNISMTTLEDVFLSVGEKMIQEQIEREGYVKIPPLEKYRKKKAFKGRTTGVKLVHQQVGSCACGQMALVLTPGFELACRSLFSSTDSSARRRSS